MGWSVPRGLGNIAILRAGGGTRRPQSILDRPEDCLSAFSLVVTVIAD
jgi:hypothetical protein